MICFQVFKNQKEQLARVQRYYVKPIINLTYLNAAQFVAVAVSVLDVWF